VQRVSGHAQILKVTEAHDLVRAEPEVTGLLVVDLDGAQPGEAEDLAAAVASTPCVVVGVAERPTGAPPLDLLLSAGDADQPWRPSPEGLDAALATVADAVDRYPQAATVLAQVLRLGRGRSLDECLTIESLAYATLQSGPEHQAWLHGRSPKPPSPTQEPVAIERQGDVVVVTLQRPEVRNAVDAATRDGLVAAFDVAARAGLDVELRGAGPDFCSGGDLAEFGTTPDPATAHLVRSTRSPARALAASAHRATAHVHGACIGAGIELAALAHRVVAREDAGFRLPEVVMGLIPGAGGTATIPRRIGPQRTAWLALTGTPLDAPTARRWNLVDTVESV